MARTIKATSAKPVQKRRRGRPPMADKPRRGRPPLKALKGNTAAKNKASKSGKAAKSGHINVAVSAETRYGLNFLKDAMVLSSQEAVIEKAIAICVSICKAGR